MLRAPYRPPLVHTIYPCIGHNRWIIEYYWIVFCGIITKRFVISRIEWNITGMGMTRLGLRYIPDKLWRRENIDRWTKNVLRTSESDAFFPWWHLNISAFWEHLLLVRNGCTCNLLMVDDCFVQPQPTTNINPFLFARTSPVWISGVSKYFVDDSGKVFKHVINPPPTEK